MADHRIADLQMRHGRAKLFDPAGILMAHDMRQRHFHLAAPDAFNDMQIGPANPGAADPHDHVGGILDLWVGNILIGHENRVGELFVIFVQYGCFHGLSSSLIIRELLKSVLHQPCQTARPWKITANGASIVPFRHTQAKQLHFYASAVVMRLVA